MAIDLPWGEIITLGLGLLVGGVVTGFLAGLLGIGGGGILVPVLYETFSFLGVPDAIKMHMVLGTSFAVIAPTALSSFRGHLAKGAVDTGVLRRLAPAVLCGVAVGVMLVSGATGVALKWVWVVCGFLLAAKMAFGREGWRLSDGVPNSLWPEAAAFVIGLVSILMSIGGGMFFVSLLTLFGFPLLRAIATSSGFGPLIAVPGLFGYMWAGWDATGLPPLSLGYINVLGAAVIIPASVLAAPYGVRVAHGLSRRRLEIAFAVFLAFVSLRLLATLV